jgi:Tol biopolymer transport system component
MSKVEGSFQNPEFSSDCKKVFFTSSNYQGIYYYDLDKKKHYTLNQESGSGYRFALSIDGRKIYYRAESAMVKKRRRFMLFEQDVVTGESRKLLKESVRNLSTPRLIKNDILLYSIDDELKLVNLDGVQMEENIQLDIPYYTVQKKRLTIHQPGKEIYQVRFDSGSLLWPDLLPSGEGMIVYVSGAGLQLITPSKNESQVLGDFRAAKWSPYENTIVYMVDIDDGERILESDIYIYNLNDRNSINLTNTADLIEMYPDWSSDGSMITYHTEGGQIDLLELNIRLNGE